MAAAATVIEAKHQRRRDQLRTLHSNVVPFRPKAQVILPKRIGRTAGIEDFAEGAHLAWMRPFLPMATAKCQICAGIGVRFGYVAHLCACVSRRICRVMTDRYRENQTEPRYSLSCNPNINMSGKDSRLSWGRKNEEFNADLWLLAKRTLDEEHFRVFRLHSLEAIEWQKATKKLGLKRGQFFHCVYRAEEAVGRAAIAIEPYPLFPLQSYFSSGRRQAVVFQPRVLRVAA